ncbi:hypothetical protein BOTBODRAFT_31942 [Botryobasidium botryosum FD-172 SS1]|uniref:Ribosome biogenesis protein YTM1 n=1 Tax=Botryobasidium botryosum (strain FD-172 SS1) TaxID=930990 RepID=A0A067MIC5_BOTB1|nr:hypothetical protein BOTBODRAFT_31942 [Botryobasidium botryosum FD-172 SS1]
MASLSAAPTPRTIPIILKTRTPYVIPAEKYMVPTTWRRFHLSQLINKVLALPTPVPFDFIANGEMISDSLGEWCDKNKHGEEETLEIEYVQSVMPPQHMSSLPHPDWVSSISCRIPGHFLTGSYDSVVRLYDNRQELVHAISGHTGPVSSVAFVSGTDSMLIASASYDTTARLTLLDEADGPKPLASLHLHTAAVSSVTSNPAGSHLLTAGWDSLIGLWTTDVPSSHEIPIDSVLLPSTDLGPRKRRKLASQPTSVDDVKRKAPSAVLKSHTARVSKAIWSSVESQKEKAWSCGWDCTWRSWDVEIGVCSGTTTAPEKVLLDMAITSDARTLAIASADRTVLLYSTTASSNPTPSHLVHPAPPTSVSTHPTSSHHIISGAQDGIVRMWDVRSTKAAVANFKREDEAGNKAGRVLAVDWAKDELVGIAGEKGVDVWKCETGL